MLRPDIYDAWGGILNFKVTCFNIKKFNIAMASDY